MLIEIKEKAEPISSSDAAAKVFRSILSLESEVDRDKEHFWAIGLNAKNIVSYVELVALGTLTNTLIHPREVFRMAIMKAVASIIVGHNHPSGHPEPSREDRMLTERLKQAGEILGIKVLDHVIIGNNNQRYFSFNDEWKMGRQEAAVGASPGNRPNILKNKRGKKLEEAIKSDKKIQDAAAGMKEAISQLLQL
jgi:DNA repair protein RadC